MKKLCLLLAVLLTADQALEEALEALPVMSQQRLLWFARTERCRYFSQDSARVE